MQRLHGQRPHGGARSRGFAAGNRIDHGLHVRQEHVALAVMFARDGDVEQRLQQRAFVGFGESRVAGRLENPVREIAVQPNVGGVVGYPYGTTVIPTQYPSGSR